jgi:hypothetical protein
MRSAYQNPDLWRDDSRYSSGHTSYPYSNRPAKTEKIIEVNLMTLLSQNGELLANIHSMPGI